jgi:hypothetical protein
MHVRVDQSWHHHEVIGKLNLARCAETDVRRLESFDPSIPDADSASDLASGKEDSPRPENYVKTFIHAVETS